MPKKQGVSSPPISHTALQGELGTELLFLETHIRGHYAHTAPAAVPSQPPRRASQEKHPRQQSLLGAFT